MVNLPSILQDTRRKASKVKQAFRRPRRPRASQPTATKDLGRWKASDDLSLITAVQQVRTPPYLKHHLVLPTKY